MLSIVLAAVLAAANAYLGLFAGMTVSASIPAAVVSMAVLRLFRRSNILENNIVQTAASSGEAVAAGVIFTIPALVLIGYWSRFHYWETFAVALVGGLLGVLCTIPLRRALIIEANLRFPEGVATAEVLRVGASLVSGSSISNHASRGRAGVGLRKLLSAAGLASLVKLGEGGMGLWSDAIEGALQVGKSVVYFGTNLSAALLAVGYIVGLNTAAVVFLGGAIGWLVLLPVYSVVVPVPEGLGAITHAKIVWSGSIRYVGIGAMLVGGLWSLVQLRKPVQASLRHLMNARSGLKPSGRSQPVRLPRTERDASIAWILVLFIAAIVPMAWIYQHVIGSLSIGLVMTLVMAVAAFLFSSIAAYMAGLVGSSSNPVSGMTIATLMLAALLLVLLIGRDADHGPAAVLLIAGVVCCAAAMGGDNLQDLKTGQLVGSTPWKQQIMQVVGVATGSTILVPVLSLLQAKYGIGAATPDHPHPLSAPQATLMAGLATAVFGQQVPWDLVGLGAAIGVGVVVLDQRQLARQSAFRLPALAVALGIYLPLRLSAAILIGGLIAEAARRSRQGTAPQEGSTGGLLFAAGLVTGEALMGIVLALPMTLTAIWPTLPADPLRIFTIPPWGPWLGVVAMVLIGWLQYRAAVGERHPL